MFEILIAVVIIAGLIVASYSDIKTREVPDWVNFSLIAAGLGIRLIYSLITWDYTYFLYGMIGFTVFLVLAYAMFYTGQWGGGDSKLLMGLGALIGINISFTEFPLIVSFIFNLLVIGAIYGIIWSISLAFWKRKEFGRELSLILKDNKTKKFKWIALIGGFLLLLLSLLVSDIVLKVVGIVAGILVILTYYLWIFLKAVENSCMIKLVDPRKLTEGDWIVKDIKYKGKRITGPKDLGIEKKQIDELVKLYKQKKIKQVLIKEGIPFVPSFLLAYIFTLLLGNILFLIIH